MDDREAQEQMESWTAMCWTKGCYALANPGFRFCQKHLDVSAFKFWGDVLVHRGPL